MSVAMHTLHGTYLGRLGDLLHDHRKRSRFLNQADFQDLKEGVRTKENLFFLWLKRILSHIQPSLTPNHEPHAKSLGRPKCFIGILRCTQKGRILECTSNLQLSCKVVELSLVVEGNFTVCVLLVNSSSAFRHGLFDSRD